MVTYAKPKDDDTPWDQRLVNYGQNTNSGLDEYKRAMGVYRSKSALGDTTGASAAQKWAGQVDTAIGGIGSRPQSETRNTLETYKTNLNKPVTPYSFDINNNQQYQQALQAAQRSAQTAGNNATVALGARGIGNSQQAMTTANQIQQRSVADVNANMLPQIMRDDYLRYRDGIADQEKQNEGLLKYANALDGLDQQDFNNKRLTKSDERQVEQDTRQKRLDNMAVKQWYEQQYGVPIEAKDDWSLVADQVKGLTPLAMREYNDKRADTKFEQDYQTRQLDNTIRNTNSTIANRGSSGGGSSRSAMDDEMDQIKLETARENLKTLKGGGKDAIKAKEEAAKKMDSEKQGLANALNSGDISYSDAEKSIQKDLSLGFYTSDEAAELMGILKQWASAAYGQRWN